jgi:hypothetical protein
MPLACTIAVAVIRAACEDWRTSHLPGGPRAFSRPLRLDVSSLPGRASALEFAVVGVGLTRFTPGVPTPFGELRLGAIGLTLGLALAPITGAGSLSLPIPATPALVGVDLHFQALHIGPGGWRLGNLASTRIE